MGPRRPVKAEERDRNSYGPPENATTVVGANQGKIPPGILAEYNPYRHHANLGKTRGDSRERPAPFGRSSMEEHLATNQEACGFDPHRPIEGEAAGSTPARSGEAWD